MRAAVCGVFILGVGNGCLVNAELLIPSGLAGLILTISPFWMVGVEALLPGGERLHGPTVFGMAIGLAGAALLFTPDAAGIDINLLNGFLLLQLGMAGWSFGSIYQRRQPNLAHPVIVGAVQQLAAGIAFVPLVLLVREHPVVWSARGVGALAYLVVFGSIVGYSAYAYALDRLPVAIVSIYPYVNAVVAVGLGWLFYREPFGAKEAAAMAVIFTGVALVKRYASAPRVRGPGPGVGGRGIAPRFGAGGRVGIGGRQHKLAALRAALILAADDFGAQGAARGGKQRHEGEDHAEHEYDHGRDSGPDWNTRMASRTAGSFDGMERSCCSKAAARLPLSASGNSVTVSSTTMIMKVRMPVIQPMRSPPLTVSS